MELLPFASFLNPDKRLFWVYMLSSLFIAGVYLLLYKKEARLNLSKKLWLHKSAQLDYLYFFVNYSLKVAIVLPVLFGAKEVALLTNRALFSFFDYNLITGVNYQLIVLLYTLTLFVVSDFTRYWLHRFLHTVPLLWEFHKVHHSAKVLNPLTFYRVHPVENLLFGLRYSVSIGVVTGVFIYFFGGAISVVEILGASAFVFIFSLFGSNLRHSHIKLVYPKQLEKFFISPRQHQIHHSRSHYNKNYGGYLAIWDSLFGSLCFSKDVGKIHFGLGEEEKRFSSVYQLLITPFINLSRRFV